ncbi:hypothetical protein DFH29DRAFT_816144, partial [Suillus ampliporus]
QSKAIGTALNDYNALVPLMSPPAPCLEWNDIIHYGFLSEFKLLKHSHSVMTNDILSKPWTVPSNREVAAKYFKIKRAFEELRRLNVEICRLHTSIYDDATFLQVQVECLSSVDPHLA